MDFDGLISRISQALDEPLPGWNAHKLGTPSNRKGRLQDMSRDPNPRMSAVLALLYPKEGELHVALMRRAEYKGTHSRQVSFPGGKQEEQDEDFLATALREANEEMGIDREQVLILGQLTEVYIPPSRFLVYPFVGFMESRPAFVLNEEVEELIEVPLNHLLDDENLKSKQMTFPNYPEPVNVPYFDVFDNHVWGATAMMIKELKVVVKALF